MYERKSVKDAQNDTRPIIAIVGPCASGKSTLARDLQAHGYNAREVSQEHSYVADMWQRITQPDQMIYLDVSWRIATLRRRIDADQAWWAKLNRRLEHARRHADFYLNTDDLTPKEILKAVLAFLQSTQQT